LPFFPTPFGFGISELLSAAVAALLEDMMLAKDNDGVADGPAWQRYIVTTGLQQILGYDILTASKLQTIMGIIPCSLALSFFPFASTVSTLRGGESWADAKPRRVTSAKRFLSLASGGLVDGPALFPRASVKRQIESAPTRLKA
jgi:hypothetical protein